MSFIGPNEAILIGAALVALVLGPKKLPQLARALGDSKKEYKKSMKEADDVVKDAKPDAESEIEEVKEE
jgi:TatA/E family protein of Tat protein translocase